MSIQYDQYRTVTWRCTLCQALCDMQEKDQSHAQLTYACICGRVYNITFGRQVTIEENRVLDAIFHVERYSTGIEVRLVWDQSKHHFARIGEDDNWSHALDQAIGYCWRMYGKGIIAHIKSMPEENEQAK